MKTTQQITFDDLVMRVLDIVPDALFDEEFRTGEIVISTGLTVRNGKLVKIDDEFLK